MYPIALIGLRGESQCCALFSLSDLRPQHQFLTTCLPKKGVPVKKEKRKKTDLPPVLKEYLRIPRISIYVHC